MTSVKSSPLGYTSQDDLLESGHQHHHQFIEEEDDSNFKDHYDAGEDDRNEDDEYGSFAIMLNRGV